jgi:hypothetical protein
VSCIILPHFMLRIYPKSTWNMHSVSQLIMKFFIIMFAKILDGQITPLHGLILAES